MQSVFFIIFKNRSEVRGIFHFSGIVKYTKFQMALLIASLFQLPTDHVECDQGTNANVQRPDNAALDSSKLSDQLGININRADFATTIKRCLQTFI